MTPDTKELRRLADGLRRDVADERTGMLPLPVSTVLTFIDAIDRLEKAEAERDALREALIECADLLEFMTPPNGYSPDGALAQARAALAKEAPDA